MTYSTPITSARSKQAPHPGAMLALVLPDETVRKLSATGASETPDHLTLVHLADDAGALNPEQRTALTAAVQALAETSAPVSGRISGMGRFANDGQDVIYASFDAPSLPGFRQALVDALRAVGLDYSVDHGFSPHITLAYLESGQPGAVSNVPALDIAFEAVTLVMAGERTDFALTGSDAHKEAGAVPSPHSAHGPGGLFSTPGSGGRRRRIRVKGWRAKDYGAKVGQAIRGNLYRGAGGKFSAGPGGAEKPAEGEQPEPRFSFMKRGKKPKIKLRKGRAPAKPKEPKSGKAPKEPKKPKTPEEKAAERRAAAAARQAEREAEQQANFLKAAEAIGIDDQDLAKSFLDFAKGGKVEGANADVLAKMGLIEPTEGGYALTREGRGFVSAALKGDLRRAQDAAAKPKQTEADVEGQTTKETVKPGVERADIPAADFVDPERRRFYIVSPGDVQDAVASFGRAQPPISYEQFRTRLIAIARRKGPEFVARLPQEWKDEMEAGGKEWRGDAQLLVQKQSDGSYRWVLFSSTAYEDRDGEVVSRQALIDDCDYADATKEYGPLVWWHLDGEQGRPLVKLGDCDFNLVVGNILIESGTFVDGYIAQAVAQKSAGLEASLGFRFPLTEPDAEGVFHRIRRKERSLLPAGRASNWLTRLFVQKESPVDIKEKIKEFAKKIGGVKADEYVQKAKEIDAAGAAAGLRQKQEGDDAPEPTGADDMMEMDLEQLAALIAELVAEKIAPFVAKQEEGAQAVAKLMDEVATTKEALKGANEKAAALEGALAARAKEYDTSKAALVRLDERLKELEGEKPRGNQWLYPGYSPTSDPATEVSAERAKEITGPERDPLDAVVDKLFAAHNGGPVSQ